VLSALEMGFILAHRPFASAPKISLKLPFLYLSLTISLNPFGRNRARNTPEALGVARSRASSFYLSRGCRCFRY
jgi:hypothetical protein